jgi:hypothetical protein
MSDIYNTQMRANNIYTSQTRGNDIAICTSLIFFEYLARND